VDHQSVVTDYFHGEKDEFCDDLPLAECRPAYQSPQGKLPRLALSVKSDFVTTAWSDDAVAVISEWIERRQRDSLMTRAPASMNLGKVFLQTMGGAVGDVPADGAAFPHRSAEFSVQFQSRWSIDAPVDVREANIEWLRGFYAAMTPWRSGSAYVNYTDVDLVDWPRAYYGPNVDRLLAVKRAYDPRNVFHSRQSIPVTA
jgi:hypothetical protein